MPQPYKVFTIYAREDAQYLKELRGQLRPLEKAGRIQLWSDSEINPGAEWEAEIVHHLDTADIILILVSAAYYDSAYIHEKEIKYALLRHEKGEAKVLPVILRPCSWEDDPVIGRLQVLPTDGKPVTDKRAWQERDDAWLDVVTGLKRTMALLEDAEKQRLAAATASEKAEAEAKAWLEKRNEEQRLLEAQRLEKERLAEARRLEKEWKRQNAKSVPYGRYAAIGLGLILLLLAVWQGPNWFGGGNEAQLSESWKLSESSKQSDTIKQLFESSKLSDSSEAKTPPQAAEETKPKFTFNYPVVRVEAGTFMMGSPETEKNRDNDECQHSVSVRAFEIGKYEVTQAQWMAVMGTNPSKFKGCNDCPVENVSWNDIQAFLKKLNAATGENYRLPSEKEWEYAARGGHKNTGYKIYAGSNNLDAVAWYIGNSGNMTHPVGQKSPNELGLYDMSGNVWEWSADTYKPYPCDNKNKADSSARCLRGGSWVNYYDHRCAVRDNSASTFRYNNYGFRLAQD